MFIDDEHFCLFMYNIHIQIKKLNNMAKAGKSIESAQNMTLHANDKLLRSKQQSFTGIMQENIDFSRKESAKRKKNFDPDSNIRYTGNQDGATMKKVTAAQQRRASVKAVKPVIDSRLQTLYDEIASLPNFNEELAKAYEENGRTVETEKAVAKKFRATVKSKFYKDKIIFLQDTNDNVDDATLYVQIGTAGSSSLGFDIIEILTVTKYRAGQDDSGKTVAVPYESKVYDRKHYTASYRSGLAELKKQAMLALPSNEINDKW